MLRKLLRYFRLLLLRRQAIRVIQVIGVENFEELLKKTGWRLYTLPRERVWRKGRSEVRIVLDGKE